MEHPDKRENPFPYIREGDGLKNGNIEKSSNKTKTLKFLYNKIQKKQDPPFRNLAGTESILNYRPPQQRIAPCISGDIYFNIYPAAVGNIKTVPL